MFSESLKEKIPSICLFFESALKRTRLANAYLLCGGDYPLKEEFAYELIKILNCLNPIENGQPCGICLNCNWIVNKQHPDLPIILEPDLEKSKKGVIVVEQIAKFLSRIQNKSQFYRVILIKTAESEQLPSQSANSLLKSIEEPNPNILFLLFTRDQEQVLPTICSRCQAINFPNHKQLSALEDNFNIDNNILEWTKIKSISFYKASQYSDIILQQKKEIPELMSLLDHLTAIYLEKEKIDLSKIKLIENAKLRLKSFCSPKNTLEELIFNLQN